MDEIDPAVHSRDCTIFTAKLLENRPYDGICTCGAGWLYLSHTGGDDRHMLAPWKRNRMEANDEE